MQALLDNATPVAVKFVTNQSFKEQERFKREVNILKSLRHINIVQFLGATVTNDKIMLVTEVCLATAAVTAAQLKASQDCLFANILKSLRHINIVQFLGATVTNDKIMLVTEVR